MNTYGHTSCPKCGALNSMFRSLAVCRHIPTWDTVKCFSCGRVYKHTDRINKIETEAEQNRGRD